MTINIEEIINACQVIANQEHLDICITESLKGAAVTGMGALVCGILMGPPGLAIGGALGGLAGASMCKSFRPLGQILMEMSEEDKRKLHAHMIRVVNSLEITDAVLLMTIVSNPTNSARETIARELVSYFGTAIAPRAIPQ